MVDEEQRAEDSSNGIEKEPKRTLVLWRGFSRSWQFNAINIAAIVWLVFGNWLVKVASGFLRLWFPG